MQSNLNQQRYEPKLETHIHQEQPKPELVGMVNVDLKEQKFDQFGHPVGATQHANFDLGLVHEPTLSDKAGVALNNAYDRTAVEMHNAKEQTKAAAINTGVAAEEMGLRAEAKLESAADIAEKKIAEGWETADKKFNEQAEKAKLMAKEAQLNLKAGAQIAQEKMQEGAAIASERFSEMKDNVTRQATATYEKASTGLENMKSAAKSTALETEAKLEAGLSAAGDKMVETRQTIEHKATEIYGAAKSEVQVLKEKAALAFQAAEEKFEQVAQVTEAKVDKFDEKLHEKLDQGKIVLGVTGHTLKSAAQGAGEYIAEKADLARASIEKSLDNAEKSIIKAGDVVETKINHMVASKGDIAWPSEVEKQSEAGVAWPSQTVQTNVFGLPIGTRHEPLLREHHTIPMPTEHVIGNVKVEITEDLATDAPLTATEGQKTEFDMPIVEKPTLLEKAKVVLTNAVDYASVELHNAGEKMAIGVLNAKEALKEGYEAVSEKMADMNHKVVAAVEHTLELDQAPVPGQFSDNLSTMSNASESNLLREHIPQQVPADRIVGQVHVQMTSQAVDSVTGELVDVAQDRYDIPVVESATLTEKMKVGLGNLADKAKVEFLNAVDDTKEELIEAGQRLVSNTKETAAVLGEKLAGAKDDYVREINDKIADRQVEVAIERANVAIERADQVIKEAELTLQQESPFRETETFKNEAKAAELSALRTNIETTKAGSATVGTEKKIL